MPFGRGEFKKTVHDLVAFLGFLARSAFVSKVRSRYDLGGSLNENVEVGIFNNNLPLKWLMSDRQSNSSESDELPPA